jgi:hypothetical protein
MAAVSETIVREFFELHDFLVRQHRKFVGQVRLEDDDIDFFVLNTHVEAPGGGVPFMLTSADLRFIHRAVVVVKGWHSGIFTPAVLAHSPEIFRFVEPRVFQQALRAFGGDEPVLKILVVPTLPQSEKAREESISILRSKGIDAVIPFRTMLHDLVNMTEVNRNYQKSDLLQIIRILKNYDFFKEPQLELFRAKGARRKRGRRQRSANSGQEQSKFIG